MSNDTILFVFGSQACVPQDALSAAKDLGYRCAIVAGRAPCDVPPGLIDLCQTSRLRDEASVWRSVEAIQEQGRIVATIAYDDEAVPVAARIASALGLPGNPVAAATAARDKAEMKRRLLAAGLPIAAFSLAQNEEQACAWAAENGYPVVVKPIRGSASQGVIRADTETDLRVAYRRLRVIVLEHGLDTAGQGDAAQLIERYLEGTELSVELVVQDGEVQVLALFDKPQPLVGPFFEETIYVTPSCHPEQDQRAAMDIARRSVAALGLTTGAVHCEIRMTTRGPVLLEVAARLIGGACSRVFHNILEDDVHRSLLRLALGERVLPLGLQGEWASGAMMLPIPDLGRLRAVRGIDGARAHPGVQDVIITARPGDVIVPFPDQGCYVGFVTAAARDPGQVIAALKAAGASIEMDLEPLRCDRMTRRLERDHQPVGDGVTVLDGEATEPRRAELIDLVAATHHPELPQALSVIKARECVDEIMGAAPRERSVWVLAPARGIAACRIQADVATLCCLGVVPAHRGTGLARALVQDLMREAARRGATHMNLDVSPLQPRAKSLYRAVGFSTEADPATAACCAC